MHVMKKLTTLLLCLALLACMTGCGSGKQEDKPDKPQRPETVQEDERGEDGEGEAEEAENADGEDEDEEEEAENADGEAEEEAENADGEAEEGEEAESGGDKDAQTASKPSHTHSYKSKTVKATCTKGGYTLYTCSCGDSYRAKETGALGHAYGSWKVDKQATTSAAGSRSRTCSRCGDVERESIPKLTDTSAYASQVVTLVNKERAKAGLAPLTAVSGLNSYALQRSKELETLFAHQRPDGSDPLDYAISLGYWTAGENIARSSGMNDTPERVMNGWMNSEGHRANILDPDFAYIGVGCYVSNGSYYWTQIFAG